MDPLPMAFDTGSTGLHVFAAANLDKPGNGVKCTTTAVTFTLGNPGKIVYSGVICYAVLRLQNFTKPSSRPIAYLTSAACAETDPGCKRPSLDNPKAHGRVYGVFGAGITGSMPVINPLLALPPFYGSVFSISLLRDRGKLVLGATAPYDSTSFPLSTGTRSDERWQNSQTCLFVNA